MVADSDPHLGVHANVDSPAHIPGTRVPAAPLDVICFALGI
jgi:hypothetical protein